jgi:hypothetical protein
LHFFGCLIAVLKGPQSMAQLSTISNLPVNITQGARTFKDLNRHSLPGSKFQIPPSEDDDGAREKSLHITTEPRFKAIKHYKDTRQDDDHFKRLLGTRTMAKTDGAGTGELSFNDIAAIERATNAEKAGDRKQYALQERVDWQDAFDKSVTRLLLDFDLTLEPTCRLSHLDRMHNWFLDHGGKQQRKARKAPGYITADRTASRMPPGSTRDLGGKLSATSQLLAGSYIIGGQGSSARGNLARTVHGDGSQTAR